jgi:hypothetical protein
VTGLLKVSGFIVMLTDQDIQEAHEKELVSAELFYKGLIDFIKWTSTLATAAILWIGEAIASTSGEARYLAGLGLIFLVFSLLLAISVVYRVLSAWGADWAANRAEHIFWLVKKLQAVNATEVSEEQEMEYVDKLMNTIDETKPFQDPRSFNRRVITHIGFLATGLLFYVIAQIVSAF